MDKYLWKGTYAGAIDTVIDLAKFLDGKIYHFLDTNSVGGINCDSYCSILWVCSMGFALFCICNSAFIVDVCENYSQSPSLSKSITGFLTNSSCSLRGEGVRGIRTA